MTRTRHLSDRRSIGSSGRLGGPSADSLTTLYTDWDELVGARLAAHTRPVGLRDGVLVVGVEDPAWATEIRFLAPTLVERLRCRAGRGRSDVGGGPRSTPHRALIRPVEGCPGGVVEGAEIPWTVSRRW